MRGLLTMLVAGAMAVFGLLMIASAVQQAGFVLAARPAMGVVRRHVPRTGHSQREQVSRVAGKGIERSTVSEGYVGEAAVVEFEAGGRKVEIESQVHGVESPYAVGSLLEVRYAPWNPRHAVLATEAPGWAGVLGGGFFGSILAGMALLVMIVFGGWARRFPNFRLT